MNQEDHGTSAGRTWHAVPPLLASISNYTVVVVVAACFGWQYGFSFGTDNQAGYILGALQKMDPSLLSNDWLTQEGQTYPAFQYLAWLLLVLNPTGWIIGIANFFCITAGAVLIYWLIRAVVSSQFALVAFLLVMGVNAITRTHSVAVSYLFEYVLQPSTLGTVGWLLATGFLVRGRWLASGIALAAGGVFHANFLLLGLPTFALAHALLGRAGMLARLVRQFGPAVPVILLLVPRMVDMASSSESETARVILFFIRSPHHYQPTQFRADFVSFAMWQFIGLSLGFRFLRHGSPLRLRLTSMLIAQVGVVWIGSLLSTVLYVPQVVQLFVWRLAPFCDLWMQILAFCAVSHIVLRRRALARLPVPSLVGAAAGCCFFLIDSSLRNQAPLVILWSAILAVVILSRFLWLGLRLRTVQRWSDWGPRTVRWLLLLAVVATWFVAAKGPTADYRRWSTLLNGFETNEVALYDWIRANTPKDAIFATPPRLERFRVQAQRAIIVDWKSHPYSPNGLVEWYRRLTAVAGREELRRQEDAEAGYRTLDSRRIESLKDNYGIAYAVVRSGSLHPSLQQYRTLYRNPVYTVLDVSR